MRCFQGTSGLHLENYLRASVTGGDEVSRTGESQNGGTFSIAFDFIFLREVVKKTCVNN
jgi:hypothetical protein